MKRRGRRRLALPAVVAICCCCFAPMSAGHPDDGQRTNLSSRGWPIAPFELVDQHGAPFTQGRLAGMWTFVLVGDTRCGQPCHQPLAALDAMYRRLSDTRILDSTQVLFVSMAPRQDTPERLRRYLAPFDARFIGATGSPPSLGRLAEDLTGGAVAAAPAQYGGSLILIDPHGAWRAEFLPPFDAMQLTAEYLKTRVRR